MEQRAETSKRWRLLSPIPREASAHLRSFHPVMAQCLYNRGQDTADKARLFLAGGDAALHDSLKMSGMMQAVSRIRHALKQEQLIAVYGDFDADGVTSAVLLTQAIEALGGRVMPYIPNRVDEGYGLNKDALQNLKEQGVRLVITVDCGIRSVDEVEYGQSIGLDMIVTDHHSVGEQYPPALAVINPKIDAALRQGPPSASGPEEMLAGVGVAYKLAEALLKVTLENASRRERERLNLEQDEFLRNLLDLVALGTVADLAPLDRLENRELVRRGLEVLNRAQRPGIFRLLEVAGIEPGSINTTSIGYMLGPRINAAGRLDSAMIAYHLLSTRDITEAEQHAQRLQELNVQRQSLTLEVVERARGLALSAAGGDVPLIFAADPDFRAGIVGLVAGRLAEEFYRPAVVVELGLEESRGSCRSIPEFDITHALDQCAELLVRHGGHTQAAGFTVRNENLPVLRARLLELASLGLSGQDLIPTLEIDAEVPFDFLTMDLAQQLKALEPCGYRNEAPLLLTRGLYVADHKRVGREEQHLRLRLTSARNGWNSIEAIGFKLGDRAVGLPQVVDVVYHLEINRWNGSEKLQLNIQDLKPAGQGEGY